MIRTLFELLAVVLVARSQVNQLEIKKRMCPNFSPVELQVECCFSIVVVSLTSTIALDVNKLNMN